MNEKTRIIAEILGSIGIEVYRLGNDIADLGQAKRQYACDSQHDNRHAADYDLLTVIILPYCNFQEPAQPSSLLTQKETRSIQSWRGTTTQVLLIGSMNTCLICVDANPPHLARPW